MRRRSTEVKVGITVVLAVIILIAGVIWIEKVSFSKKYVSYTVYFNDVGGLDPGDPVTVSGVNAGEVGAVVLEPGRVKTEILIDEDVTLFDDCKVEILTVGLMGEKYIGIDPGRSGKVLAPGSVIQGEYKAGMAEAVAGFGDVVTELRETVRSIRTLVESVGGGTSLAELIQRVDDLATELVEVIRQNRDDIRSTTRSMKTVSGSMEDIFETRKGEIEESIDRFSVAAARLDSLTSTMKEIVEGVEQGEGTLGMLVKEKKLHEDLELVVENLNALIEDVKEHPERYFKIEIF
jgi:phospholipid/cholesterol/gamma-HCH transport system substrate-binding protein